MGRRDRIALVIHIYRYSLKTDANHHLPGRRRSASL